MDVSIILACRNEETSIEGCLRSILRQAQPPGGMEVIVADGQSDDATPFILNRLAEEDHRLIVIENPGRIVSCGLNAAIRAARGNIIIRIDAHTLYAMDYVPQCLAALDQTGADNVGGPARTHATGYIQRVVGAAYHSPFAVGGARFHDPTHQGYVDTVPYGCWSREVFDRVGLFDEELVRNQDDEHNLRIRRAGGRIWQTPHIKSWYRPRGSLAELFRQYLQYGYWKVAVIRKHKIPASPRHVVPGIFMIALVSLLFLSLWWSPALWAFISIVSTYVAAVLAASVFTAARSGWSLLPLLPVTFVVYHIGYGLGFARGIFDFLIMRRRPSRAFVALSRRSVLR